jgi:hypothetical protein
MDPRCDALCEHLARAVVARDFTGAQAVLAPWLRTTLGPAALEAHLDAANEGLTHPPHSWTIGEGLSELSDLRKPDPYSPPTKPLPREITDANFRGWLSIQFAPEPAVHDEQNICYDLWIVAVEHEGAVVAGYLEAWEAS